jgi:hypothetical protein
MSHLAPSYHDIPVFTPIAIVPRYHSSIVFYIVNKPHSDNMDNGVRNFFPHKQINDRFHFEDVNCVADAEHITGLSSSICVSISSSERCAG